MNGSWSKKWKQVLIWFSGYISFLAFAIVGGYTVAKVEDEDLKKTAKQTFFVVLIFAAMNAALALFNYIGGFSDSWYSSSAYDFYSNLSKVVSILQILVYAIIIVWTLVKGENHSDEQK